MTNTTSSRLTLGEVLGVVSVVAAVIVIGMVVSPRSSSSDGVAERGRCVAEQFEYVAGSDGRIDTPTGSYEIISTSMGVTDGDDLCGYVRASTIDPPGERQPTSEVFSVRRAVVEGEHPRTTLDLSIVDPFGAEAGGTLDGVASGGAVLYSGTLFDVGSGELAINIVDLDIGVADAAIAAAGNAADEFAASGMFAAPSG